MRALRTPVGGVRRTVPRLRRMAMRGLRGDKNRRMRVRQHCMRRLRAHMQRMRFADVRGLHILLRALRAQPVRGLRVPVPHVRRPPVLGLPGILRAVRRTLLPLLLRTARLREHAGPLLPGPVRGTARPRAVHLRTGNRSGRQPRHRHAQEPQAHRRLVPGRQPPPRRLPRIPERTHDHEPAHGNPPTRRTHRHRHRQHAVGRAHAHQPHRPADPGPLVLGAGSARRKPNARR